METIRVKTKIRAFFSILKKGQGKRPPPSPISCVPVSLAECISVYLNIS